MSIHGTQCFAHVQLIVASAAGCLLYSIEPNRLHCMSIRLSTFVLRSGGLSGQCLWKRQGSEPSVGTRNMELVLQGEIAPVNRAGCIMGLAGRVEREIVRNEDLIFHVGG